jgi:ribonuclease HII
MLDDSKKLTAEQRLAAFAALRRSKAEIAVAAASVAEIERLNILHAAMLAMCRAVARLPAAPDLALVDGNYPPPMRCPVQCVVGGDTVSLSIAAASIIAKVVRDRLMERLARRYPGYGWHTNAGYGTRAHRDALLLLGPTRHHRAGFAPVAERLLANAGLLQANAGLFPEEAGLISAEVGVSLANATVLSSDKAGTRNGTADGQRIARV